MENFIVNVQSGYINGLKNNGVVQKQATGA